MMASRYRKQMATSWGKQEWEVAQKLLVHLAVMAASAAASAGRPLPPCSAAKAATRGEPMWPPLSN